MPRAHPWSPRWIPDRRPSLIRTAASLPKVIGEFRIAGLIDPVDGVVYEAMQEHPRRRVAIKMMKRGIASDRLNVDSVRIPAAGPIAASGDQQVYEAGTHDDGEGVPLFRHGVHPQ